MEDHSLDGPTTLTRRDFIAAGKQSLILTAASAAGVGQVAAAPAPNEPLQQPAPLPPARLRVERQGAVLVLTLDRPEVSNLLDAPLLIALGREFWRFDHDDSLRVAVLCGAGADFCGGVDAVSLAAAQAAGQLPSKDPEYIQAFGLRPPYRTKPLVVAVHGATRFGGHELFLYADVRVAAADAVFSQGEVTRASFPSGGATGRFVREVGWGNAMRFMLTGDEWTATEAHRMGLVQEIVPPGKQLERALRIATKIAAAAPLGVRATLASAREAQVNEEQAFAHLAVDFSRLVRSEDRKEAIKASEEGRQPVFRGL